jgi:wyosine [tRNA(Phe)-imidazoG37] synthetase (radical SAM superfamily)
MVLPLKQGILYGPVNSRRYGKSLGINLMPVKNKLCSFNCVYCHYGLTRRCTMNSRQYDSELPLYDDVVKALEEALQSTVELDLITFSGNGEPTLHPQFAELVEAVVELRDKYRPEAKVALLSNSTGLTYSDVFESIESIDLPVLKLDVGSERLFRVINRPARGIDFEQMVDKLSSLDDIYIQSVFVDGRLSNRGPKELEDYVDRLMMIKPKEVHLYSIDRPSSDTRISLVLPDGLDHIVSEIKSAGITARAFHA